MKNNFKEFIKPIVVLTLIAAVMTALLSGTNLITTDRISLLSEQAEQEAVKKVISAESYEKGIIDEHTYFTAKNKNGEIVGYAFSVSGTGYGGAVKTVVGIDYTGTVTAVEVTDVSNETPGLGQNAKNPDFAKGFIGKSEPVSVVKNGPKEKEVQAVTGATITSTAVANSVNTAFELFEKVEKAGGTN